MPDEKLTLRFLQVMLLYIAAAQGHSKIKILLNVRAM